MKNKAKEAGRRHVLDQDWRVDVKVARLGERGAERMESLFLNANVTAEAVTYKAKAESKNAGKSACATEVRLLRGE